MYRIRLLDSEKVRVGCSERTALKQVYCQGWNRSPAQVGCMRQVLRAGALGRPRGMGWRGRLAGGSGWATHVNPWLIHVNGWQKPLQYCKVISLQQIKINGKKSLLKMKKKESWALKNWCFWIVVLKNTLESLLDCKEPNQSIVKEISPKYSLKWLMLKLKLQYFGHLMQKNWLLRKDLDSGKDWRWEEKGMTEDEMVGWQYHLNGQSLTIWPQWVWESSRSWWWTGKYGVL